MFVLLYEDVCNYPRVQVDYTLTILFPTAGLGKLKSSYMSTVTSSLDVFSLITHLQFYFLLLV